MKSKTIKLNDNNKVCLVLEGGAFRGIYTAGILDALYDNNINIDCIIGVSAGALFGVNYFSNQPRRVIRYNKKYCNDKRFISFISLIFTGNIINKRFAYYKVSKKLDPFDQDAFIKSNKKFYAVATNVDLGKAEYFQIKKPIDELEKLRASSAMPLVTKIVSIGKNHYLDGAITDSIPIKKAIEMGYKKIVVILTQPKNYVKNALTENQIKLIKRKYKKYPKFITASIERPKMYNETLNLINQLESKSKIFVFRPSNLININPVKKTISELDETYTMGYNECIKNLKDLKKYLR